MNNVKQKYKLHQFNRLELSEVRAAYLSFIIQNDLNAEDFTEQLKDPIAAAQSDYVKYYNSYGLDLIGKKVKEESEWTTVTECVFETREEITASEATVLDELSSLSGVGMFHKVLLPRVYFYGSERSVIPSLN